MCIRLQGIIRGIIAVSFKINKKETIEVIEQIILLRDSNSFIRLVVNSYFDTFTT